MNDSPQAADQPLGSMRRRDFLTAAAAAGALAWTAPVILSRPAYADDDDGGGTPKCRPKIKLRCVQPVPCADEQGNKAFAGIEIDPGATCPCDGKAPDVCVQIIKLTSDKHPNDIVAYRPTPECGNQGDRDLFPVDEWTCLSASDRRILFGRRRDGSGSIPEMGNETNITFTIAVWAGNCPDADSEDEAFRCKVFDVTITYLHDPGDPTDQDKRTAICDFQRSTEDMCMDEDPCRHCFDGEDSNNDN